MSKGYFQTLPAKQRKLIGQKGGQSQRSEKVQDAWDHQHWYKDQYANGESIKDLAKFAHISERTMFRIVKGK